MFLCRVWGHVYLVVSDRCEFCLILSVCLDFMHLSSCTRVFNSQSCIHAGLSAISAYTHGFTVNSRVCHFFYLFVEVKWLLGEFWYLLSLLWHCLSLLIPLFLTRNVFFRLNFFLRRFLSGIFYFLFEISALEVFYLSALLECCLCVLPESRARRIIFFAFCISCYFKKSKNICLSSCIAFCILHCTCTRFALEY